jgi:heat shock protein HtpX
MTSVSQLSMPRQYSLVVWALLALVIVIVSYTFTLAMALACVGFCILILSAGLNMYTLVLGFISLGIGISILWSLIPRRDKFQPPGAVLQRSQHPRLFAEIDNLAVSLKQSLPQEVYLIPDLNAWVAERGGTMGFGGRRMMGIGLPLLSVLSVTQFRAILAHEYGHYYGGDTRLGPFVYNTRNSMVRTIRSLAEPSAFLQALMRLGFPGLIAGLLHGLVVAILVGYWKLLLRVTQLISRRQEYRADELACQLVGSEALVSGLRIIHGASLAVPVFWSSEVSPVLVNGMRPPIGEGFRRFVAAPQISKVIEQKIDRDLREAKTQAYDSHPPLRDRIAAASRWSSPSQVPDDTQAMTLVDDVDGIELKLLQALNPGMKAEGLTSVSWDSFVPKYLLVQWRQRVAQSTDLLGPLTAASLPDVAKDIRTLGSRISDPKGMLLTPEQRSQRAVELIGVALGLLLVDHGWILVAQPGVLCMKRDEEEINPFTITADVLAGRITSEAWIERCEIMGISGCRMATPAPMVGS